MSGQAADLAQALARHAEAVCRYYLPKGRRHGRYWLAGDINDTPGRSLYVRLTGPDAGPGAAGKWTDAATGEHGDLLDLIAANRGLDDFHDVCVEVRRFLSLPLPKITPCHVPVTQGSPEAAGRLFRAGVPIKGTHAEAYLRARGITAPLDGLPLRFHPALWYRRDSNSSRESWPGLLAAVTDARGRITGVHRTWLDRSRHEKAPLPDPRRALGHLLGNGVRFGSTEPAPAQAEVLLAGEGIETVLSLKSVLPRMPMIAALSANHLAALEFTAGLARLYVAQDAMKRGGRPPAGFVRAGMTPESRCAISCRYGEISTRIYAGQDMMHYSRGSWTSLLRVTSCGSCAFKTGPCAADPFPPLPSVNQDVSDGSDSRPSRDARERRGCAESCRPLQLRLRPQIRKLAEPNWLVIPTNCGLTA